MAAKWYCWKRRDIKDDSFRCLIHGLLDDKEIEKFLQRGDKSLIFGILRVLISAGRQSRKIEEERPKTRQLPNHNPDPFDVLETHVWIREII